MSSVSALTTLKQHAHHGSGQGGKSSDTMPFPFADAYLIGILKRKAASRCQAIDGMSAYAAT